MNWLQRILLMFAGAFLFMLAFGVATGSYDGSAWLALVEFVGGVACFFFAFSPSRKPQDAE